MPNGYREGGWPLIVYYLWYKINNLARLAAAFLAKYGNFLLSLADQFPRFVILPVFLGKFANLAQSFNPINVLLYPGRNV